MSPLPRPAESRGSGWSLAWRQRFHLAAGRRMAKPTQPTSLQKYRVADRACRLGVDNARVSWRTPVKEGTTLADLLRRRRLGDVHRFGAER